MISGTYLSGEISSKLSVSELPPDDLGKEGAKQLLEEDGIQLLHHDRGPKFGQYACQKPTKTLIDALESIGYVFYQSYEYPGAWMEPIPCPTIYEAEKLKQFLPPGLQVKEFK